MNHIKAIIAFFILIFISLSSFASVYTVKGIEVKSTGQNATEARDNALLKGEREAFYKLLTNNTPDFLHHALPKITDEEISSLVVGLEVENEKITANTYRATISISFNPDYTRKIITDSGLTYIEAKKEPIIVIPGYSENSIIDVTRPNNLWQQAWNKAKDNSDFINFIFVKDPLEIDFENPDYEHGLPENEQSQVNSLLDKYNSDKIIIAKANFIPESTAPIFVKLVFVSKNSIDQTSKSFSLATGEELPAKLESIALDLVEKMNSKWKKNQGDRKSAKLKINVNIPISGLSQWNLMYRQLSKLSFIEKIDINKISTKQADLDLHFQTSYQDFINSLAQEGLYIENENERLELKRYTKAPPVQNNQQDKEYEQINGFEG